MKLRVYIVCAECGESKEVYVLGGFDIKDVRHSCQRSRGVTHLLDGREIEPGEFGVSFDPPRVFA